MSDIQRLLITAKNLEEEMDSIPPFFSEADIKNIREAADEITQLRAQIVAHEKVCAGEWVRCDERLPKAYRVVETYHGGSLCCFSNNVGSDGNWFVNGYPNGNVPIYWLDARMPGEER